MTGSEGNGFQPCTVCGETDHLYTHHLGETGAPEFVHDAVARLRALEMSGSPIHELVTDVEDLTSRESGARRAWALWLAELLEELEEASDAPDVAEQIEAYLMGAFGD